MNIRVSMSLLLLLTIHVCLAARLTDDQLEQILSEKIQSRAPESSDYVSLDEINELETRLAGLEKLDDVSGQFYDDDNNTPEDGAVSKRPFCNGFTGCGRIRGKRLAPTLLLDVLRLSNSLNLHDSQSQSSLRTKRPFCNGFFGCGNPGKRLMFRNSPKGYRRSRNAAGQKRFFCNPGAFGCINRNKRNSWFDGMRTVTSSDE